jgi:phage terminase small subunit
MKDFLEFRTAKTVVDHDRITGEPIIDYAQILNVKDSDEVDGSLISEVSISKDGTFKFKLHDKLNALEKAGKHLGMFIEKHELTGKDGGPLETTNRPDLSKLSIEELKQLAELTKRAAGPG